MKSFAKHVVITLSWKMAVYASRLELPAPAAERAVQNAWSEEYTAPSLLFADATIRAVMGVLSKGSLSVEHIEPDLEHILFGYMFNGE